MLLAIADGGCNAVGSSSGRSSRAALPKARRDTPLPLQGVCGFESVESGFGKEGEGQEDEEKEYEVDVDVSSKEPADNKVMILNCFFVLCLVIGK